MPFELASKVFSTETLVEGVQLVKSETGMDSLSAENAALQRELEQLEVGVWKT